MLARRAVVTLGRLSPLDPTTPQVILGPPVEGVLAAVTADAAGAFVGVVGTSGSLSAVTEDATGAFTGAPGVTAVLAAFTEDARSQFLAAVGTSGALAAVTEDATGAFAGHQIITGILAAVTEDAFGTENLFTTFVYHADVGGFTEYSGFNFNSYARLGAHFLAAGDGGLYALAGADDDGAPISAYFSTDSLDLGNSVLKRIPQGWMGYSGGPLAIAVTTTLEGEAVENSFSAQSATAAAMRAGSFKIARGLVSRYWQFTFYNVAGSDFAIDQIELLPEPLTRRR